MRKFLVSILDFLLPRHCLHCSNKLPPDVDHICKNCFKFISSPSQKFLITENDKKFFNSSIQKFTSAFLFLPSSPIQNLIHNLKYSSNYNLGCYLGEVSAQKCLNSLKEWNIDFIVPVPLHSNKKAERGYNQAYYIAKGISKIIDKPVYNRFLKRVKYTVSQTGFNLEERKNNMRNAFEIRNEKKFEGKNILIVDDVITTGATILACAEVLKEKKAKNVFAFSIAIPSDSTSYQEQKLPELQDHS